MHAVCVSYINILKLKRPKNFRPEETHYAIPRNTAIISCSLHYSVTPYVALKFSYLYSKVPSVTLILARHRLIILLLLIHVFLAYVTAHSIIGLYFVK
jgi:hypothetical protein